MNLFLVTYFWEGSVLFEISLYGKKKLVIGCY